MGKQSSTGAEQASSLLAGSFTAIGVDGTTIAMSGAFNFWASGGNGTVVLEASFDGGNTWAQAPASDSGSLVSVVTGSANGLFRVNEPEPGVLYRAHCTAFTSGTINYRISGGPRLT